MRAAHPLRAMTQEEEQALERSVKASSERVDVVKRARALLAVRAGKAYSEAAQEAGYKSGDSVSQLVERFNQHALAGLFIAPGRGRKETYTSEQREGADCAGVPAGTRPPGRRHGNLVADDPAGSIAQGRPAQGRSEYHPRGIA